ncbi:GNAT family acetyltransferase [Desulfospira joergensenii]|uniref:GNAT family acetyltransferase n=1 Tax=Desulfospira joergensenii TaxID=53329 RepID=UPI0003B4C31A|nr:GNAT family acetyltransferase [Desulfospira joergensenii]
MEFMDPLEIKPFTPDSTSQVIQLWEECGLTRPWNDPEKDIQRKLLQNPELFFLAWKKETLVGSCMAGYDGHRGWIYYLGVTPELRETGIGKALLDHAEKALARLGCPKINLMVRKTNSKVIRFYENRDYSDDPVKVLSKRLENDTE